MGQESRRTSSSADTLAGGEGPNGDEHQIYVPDKGGGREPGEPQLHPLVAFERARRPVAQRSARSQDPAASQKRQTRHRRLDSRSAAGLHIQTSRVLHDRALRILQALITGFEQRGFTIAATNEGARVTILDERLGFGIEEGLKKVEHAITFTEQKLIDRGLGYQVPKFDQVPSGDLPRHHERPAPPAALVGRRVQAS